MEHLINLLTQYRIQRKGLDFTVSRYESAEELLSHEESTGNLYLLDAVLPGMNGVELARKLRGRGVDAAIIFLTTSRDFAVEAFAVWAANYLVKPIDEERLFPVLDVVLKQPQPKREICCIVDTNQGGVSLPLSKIMYLEMVSRVIHYHMEDGVVILSKYVRSSFADSIPEALRRPDFIQPHQSFLINASFIVQMNREAFTLKNNIHIPISRLRRAEVRAQYFALLRQQIEERAGR